MNKGIKGNSLYITIVVLFTIYFMTFPFPSPPLWIHIAGIAGVTLFIFRIIRGDD
ncbi:MAG: hypothetical protein J0H29_16875 [Sphingobacteriales bacterium]|nr:hypothetical protein [Sphingobacteriales bacterium]